MNAKHAKALRRLRALIDPAGNRPELERVLKASYNSWNAPKRERMMAHVRRVLAADPEDLKRQIDARAPGVEDLAAAILPHMPKRPGQAENPMQGIGLSLLKGGAAVETLERVSAIVEQAQGARA